VSRKGREAFDDIMYEAHDCHDWRDIPRPIFRAAMQSARADGDPDNLPETNPIPGGREKWEATSGLWRLKLSGAEFSFMSCVIDMANVKTGYCWPGLDLIAMDTDRPISTLKSASRSLRRRKLLRVETKTVRTKDGKVRKINRYYPNWDAFLAAFDKRKALKAARTKARRATHTSRVSSTSPARGEHDKRAELDPREVPE